MKSTEPKTKAQILTELCQIHQEYHADMKLFVKTVEEKVKNFVKTNKKLYKKYENMWFLFSDCSDFAECMRLVTRELEDNVKEQNINGPFTSWTSHVGKLLSCYLKYFRNYHIYFPIFREVKFEEPVLNEFLKKCEISYGNSITKFFTKYISLPDVLSKKYAEFSNVITQGHDYNELKNIMSLMQDTKQKAAASLDDGVPENHENFRFMEISKHEAFGSICDTFDTEENVRYKSHVISKISHKSLEHQEQIKITLEALSRCQHTNIMNISYLFEDELFYYIVYPYTEEMELSCIIERGGSLPEAAARPIFRQLMHAIQHIHTKGVVHGNISPSKIIIYKNRVKLYDFSCAHFARQEDNLGIIRPSLHYAPPDSLKGTYFNGFAADIWSAGVILFEILTGKKLFNGSSEEVIKRKISRAMIVYPKEFSPSVISLLRGILQPRPDDRLSIEQILSHPWMKKTIEVTVKNVVIATPSVSPSVSPLATRPVTPNF